MLTKMSGSVRNETTKNNAITNALQRRKSLQEAIQKNMQDLEQVELFLKLHRQFTTSSEEASADIESPKSLGTTTGWGHAQETFENLLRMVLRDVQRPLQSGEVVDEFRTRGHAIGGANETKQAWNRLWSAKKRGVLVHMPKLGYWLADEPLPAGALSAPKPTRKRKAGGGHNKTGRPIGRTPMLSEKQLKQVEEWLVAGDKTITEICAELGGISAGTIYNNFPGGRRALLEKRAKASASKPKR